MQVLLQLSEIRTDGGTQSRAALDQTTVDEYAESMLSGVEFPPVVVYADDLENWLAEGFHRYAAATKAGLQAIKATVVSGDRRAALLHSLTSNAKHGLRRTNNDKRHCVTLMLKDEEWAAWSDNQIAKTCNVSQPFVSEIRKSLTYNIISEDGAERTFTTKHGTQAAMKTANIGKKKAGVQPKPPDEYACNACGEIFDRETWHCPTCNEHWPVGRDTCLNCYKAPEVTAVKLSPGASGQGEVISLQDAFDWKKISESYHTENALLKKELQGYMQTLDLIESENGKFIPAPSERFDPDCDRDYWPENDNSKLGGAPSFEAGLAAELAQAIKDKAHWFGVAEQLREDLDESKALLTQLEEEEMEFLRAKLEEAKKEGEGWYCEAKESREKFDRALAKQQKQAAQLLNLKSELDSVKQELGQANLEIETLKMSRDSFYKKILEMRAGMNPLYEELNRLRDETKKLQAQTEPIDVIAVRSGNEALRADNKDLKSKVMELEQQLLQRDLRVASLEARTEILQKENLDLKNGEWEIPGRKKNISIKRKKTANGEVVEPERLEDGTLFYPVTIGKEATCE